MEISINSIWEKPPIEITTEIKIHFDETVGTWIRTNTFEVDVGNIDGVLHFNTIIIHI